MDFCEEKLEECKREFGDYMSRATISPELLDKVRDGFRGAFRAALTDEGDDDFGPAAWKMTEKRLKANVRKMAALAEYFAREDAGQNGGAVVTVEHVKKALQEVKCDVTTGEYKKRKLDYCGGFF